jgi:ThiS family.
MDIMVYGPLRGVTGEKTVTLAADPETVGDAIDAFVEAYPRAESQLCDCEGTLRPSVRVRVDEESADLDDACPANASLQVFPAMRGG